MHEHQPRSTELPTSVWDDLETLVFDREDFQAALDLPCDESIPVDATALERSSEDDDEWLASLPAATFEVLAQASRRVPSEAPRLAFAIALPAPSHP